MNDRITYYTVDSLKNYEIKEEFYWTDKIKNLINLNGFITFEQFEGYSDESCFGTQWQHGYFKKEGYTTKEKAIEIRNDKIDNAIKYNKKEIKRLKENKLDVN